MYKRQPLSRKAFSARNLANCNGISGFLTHEPDNSINSIVLLFISIHAFIIEILIPASTLLTSSAFADLDPIHDITISCVKSSKIHRLQVFYRKGVAPQLCLQSWIILVCNKLPFLSKLIVDKGKCVRV